MGVDEKSCLMAEYIRLIEKGDAAAARHQDDVASQFFCEALEIGSRLLDLQKPGTGAPWRGINKSLCDLVSSIALTESGAHPTKAPS